MIIGTALEVCPVLAVSVLIVDDHASFRRVARSVVEATPGFVVVGTASTGEESVEAAERLLPDLVLMDVNLPGIDGIEATRRLRARSPGSAVILLSTYDEATFDQPAVGSGALTYVAKSAFGPQRLIEAWAMATGA
jgi:DNA-binding NarL/FixJ family response regulator